MGRLRTNRGKGKTRVPAKYPSQHPALGLSHPGGIKLSF